VHFAVPFSALVSAGVKPKKAFLASLFSLLPDFDALFLVHRSFSHSLFVIMCAALPFVVIATWIYKILIDGFFSPFIPSSS
jgi:membrane-bound metal-dependent hydrolase YbcI (DUF457 family)